MITHDSVETMQQIFKLNRVEAMDIANAFPGLLAQKLADRFVDTHWKAISKDKELMAEVKRLTLSRSVALIADMIEQKIAEALGAKDDAVAKQSKQGEL